MSCGRLISPTDLNSGVVISRSQSNPKAVRPRTLLLGLGNDLLSDDSIGLRIVDGAREYLAKCEDVVVLKTTEMGLALLDLIVGFDNLIFVDAVLTGQAPPGFLHQVRTEDLDRLLTFSPHCVGVGEVLALGRELAANVPDTIRIFGVEVQDPFTVGYRLTPALEAALPLLVQQIVAEIRSLACLQ